MSCVNQTLMKKLLKLRPLIACDACSQKNFYAALAIVRDSLNSSISSNCNWFDAADIEILKMYLKKSNEKLTVFLGFW